MPVTVFTDINDIPNSIADKLRYPNWPVYQTSLNWFECLFTTAFSAEHRLRIYVVTTSNNKLSLALFCAHDGLTQHLKSLTNFYTTEFSACEFGSSSDVAAAYETLAEFILNEKPAWHSLEIRYLNESVTMGHPLITRLSEGGFYCRRNPSYENWHIAVEGKSFDEYYSALSSKVRNTIRRKEKQLAKAGHVEIRFFEDNNDTLKSGVTDYVRIYNSSWKKPEPYPDFIPALASNCADLGTLLLGVLYLDDNPIAAQLWIVTSSKALIYKLAYVDSFSSLSPGSVLSKALFEKTLNDFAPIEIDYGIGAEKYKQEWMDSVRTVHSLHGYNTRTINGLAMAGYYKIRSVLKSLLPKNAQ